MSAETVQEIIVKAVTDEDFRELLFSDPDKALGDFELTDEEAAGLRAMEREKFDAVAGELEERVSRAGFMEFGKPAEFKELLEGLGLGFYR